MKQKLEEYYTIIEKTAVYPQKVDNFGLAYAMFGLLGEYAEYQEKLRSDVVSKEDIQKEAGDVLWYIAAICKETGMNFSDIIENRDYEVTNFNAFEAVKKFYRDSKPLDLKGFSNSLKHLVCFLLMGKSNDEILEILQMNYDKLIQRRANNTINGDGDNR